MRTTLVYDLPTRIFHWLFSLLFVSSFLIAKTVDDESVTFVYHMLSGLLLGGLVIWRIYWGFFGSGAAKFSQFTFNLADLKNYFAGILNGSKKRWMGHNPASSWATMIMLILGLGLSFTGYLMASGNREAFEDIHEFLATSFLVVVIVHIAGVILHSVRHKDNVALSMIDGRKGEVKGVEGIGTSRNFAALILLALIGFFSVYLWRNFDPQNGTLQLFNQTLQLAENESEKNEKFEANEDAEGEENHLLGTPNSPAPDATEDED